MPKQNSPLIRSRGRAGDHAARREIGDEQDARAALVCVLLLCRLGHAGIASRSPYSAPFPGRITGCIALLTELSARLVATLRPLLVPHAMIWELNE